jgi:putative hemolysin
MSTIAIEIFFIVLLIVANGLFSGSEMAVVSARKARLEQMANRGDAQAKAALKLANSPNDFLSTVQIGITLIGILSGALGQATLSERLQPLLNLIPFIKPYSEGISVAIVVSIITYLSLIIGELIPKRIALNNPEKIACFVAKPMRLLSQITAPIVHLLNVSSDGLLKLLSIQTEGESTVTEEEIKVLIEQATQSGTFEESEQEIVERVFRLGDRPIKAFMTPRFEITWLSLNAPPEETQRRIIESPYSRFPVGEESLDKCLGIIRGSTFLSARLSGDEINLEMMLESPLYIPENTAALRVLEEFKTSGTHMALITDEYGDIEGLVTLTDLMEAIVGGISSLEDLEEPMIVQREDGSWLLDGLLSIDEVKDLLDKEYFPEEETGNYHTLGGLVISFLRHIPKSGEHFEWEGLRFEVVDMDGTRVDKVLVMLVVEETQLPENREQGTGSRE